MRFALVQKKRYAQSLLFGMAVFLGLSTAMIVTLGKTNAAQLPPSASLVTLSVIVDSEIEEPGGVLTYTLGITNNFPAADVAITALTDSLYGNLTENANPQLNSTTCALGSIAPGETYSCEFTTLFLGNVGVPDRITTITATGQTADIAFGETSEAKAISIVNAVPAISVKQLATESILEPGGIIEYRVRLSNHSVSTDLVQLVKLEDDIYGDLTNIANPLIIDSDCVLDNIDPGDTTICRFRVLLLGNAGDAKTNVLTVQARDDEDTLTAEVADDHTITIEDRLPDISISKAALPSVIPETGAAVDFRIRMINNSPEAATLTTLNDSVFGDLHRMGNCIADGTIVLAGDTPTTPEGDNEYTCTFTQQISGDYGGASHVNTATATVQDDEGNSKSESDGASVIFTDTLPSISAVQQASPPKIPETGGDVTFSIEVTNNTAEEIAIDSLVDSIYGDLRQQGECTADEDTLIPGNGLYTCRFTRFVSGEFNGPPHQNTIIVQARDDEENLAEENATATVSFLDALPQITVSQDANPPSVPESGGMVVFTIKIANDTAEDVTLHSLTDDKFGDLNGVGDCVADGVQTVPGDGTYSCSFTEVVAGNGGTSHINVVTAFMTDNEENESLESDSATVEIVNASPEIQLVVNADPATVLEYGETVLYRVSIENGSSSDVVTISTLAEATFGDVTKIAGPIVATNCDVPQTLATNESKQSVYECEFSAALVGNAGDTTISELTTTGTDDDGDAVVDDASASIGFTNAPAPLFLAVVADPKSIPEGGVDVEFNVSIRNDSPIDQVSLTGLADSLLGDLTKTTPNGVTGILATDCSVPQTLNPGRAYNCKFTATIPGDAVGSYVSTVSATGTDDDNSPASDTSELEVLIAQPLLSLTKEDLLFIDADRNFVVTPGDTIFYRMTIRNDGNAPATGVVLEDTPDPNTKLIPDTIMTDRGAGDVNDEGIIVIAIGTLQANQQATMSFQILFAPADAIKQIENQAVVKFDDPLPGSTRRIFVNSDDPDTKETSDKTLTPVMYNVDPSGIIFLPAISR